MRGKDAESLESVILDQIDEIKELKVQDRANKDTMRTLTRSVKGSYQKFGMVKYNAFKGMGGNLSFALALLDLNNTGFILNSVHSREGCYLYIKSVEKGETDIGLGNEEKEALEQALGYSCLFLFVFIFEISLDLLIDVKTLTCYNLFHRFDV